MITWTSSYDHLYTGGPAKCPGALPSQVDLSISEGWQPMTGNSA